MLFFFHYVRFTNNHFYEDFSGELLNNNCMHLFVDVPIAFLDGICGIGWNLEYMKKRGLNHINNIYVRQYHIEIYLK